MYVSKNDRLKKAVVTGGSNVHFFRGCRKPVKALGASNFEIAKQFLAEIVALMLMAGIGAVLVAALSIEILQRTLSLTTTLDRNTFALIIVGGFAFASIGSLYPIVKGMRLSPVEAMKST